MNVNYEKAEIVLSRLLDAYFRKEFPFNQPNAVPPQVIAHLPHSLEWGSREHSLFLFAVCYWMRGGIQSVTAIKALARLYAMAPGLFLPESVESTETHLLAATFSLVGLGFNAAQIAEMWKDNLKRIAERWGGDPRNIFSGITTYEEACERIQNKGKKGFRGFQEKMVSMLTYFYMDAGVIDRWHFPIPVDFHVLRTVFAHEIVVAEASEFNGNGFYTKPILAAVRKLFLDYSIAHHTDPIILCEAVWLYSGLMCNQHPGNTSIVGERKGRKTEIVPVPRWSAAQARVYARTCGVCTIQGTCQWCVPSAEYYIGGRITLRGERDAPQQGLLFPIVDQQYQNM
jgi:hypothetical protein